MQSNKNIHDIRTAVRFLKLNSIKSTKLGLGFVFSLVVMRSAYAQVLYDFEDGSRQGWTESNPIRGGDFGGELRHTTYGGNPAGCLMGVDTVPKRGSLATKAPSELTGDLRRYKQLIWDAWIPSRSTLSTSVLIEGPGQTLYRSSHRKTPSQPVQRWFEKRANFMSPEEWTLVRGSASFSEVVENTNALYIELDTTQGLGEEAKIDNVRALNDISADSEIGGNGASGNNQSAQNGDSSPKPKNFATPSVSISNLTYISGQPVNGKIEIPANGRTRIQFVVDLSNPDGHQGHLKVFTKQCSTCSRIERASTFVHPHNDSFGLSADVDLSASEFKSSGGTLFATFIKVGDLEYNSPTTPIIVKREDRPKPETDTSPNPPLTENSFHSCTGPSFLSRKKLKEYGPNSIAPTQTVEAGKKAKTIYGQGPGAHGISNFNRFFWVKWELGSDGYVKIKTPEPSFEPGLFLDPGEIRNTTRYRRIAEVLVDGQPKWICSYSSVEAIKSEQPNIASKARVSHSRCDGSFLNDSCSRESYATDTAAYNDVVDAVLHNGNVLLNTGDSIELRWNSEIRTSKIYIDWGRYEHLASRAFPSEFSLEYFNKSADRWEVLAQKVPASGVEWYNFEFDEVTTDRIRIGRVVVTGDAPAGFSELYVFGEYQDRSNKALVATPSGDSAYSFGSLYPITAVNDGFVDHQVTIEGTWQSMPVGSTSVMSGGNILGGMNYVYGPYKDVGPAYLQLDWPEDTPISEVRIHSDKDSVHRNYTIEYWNGSSWITVVSVADNVEPVSTDSFNLISTKKLRIGFTRMYEDDSMRPRLYRANVFEVEVF